jgi:hypothetical protein
MGGLLVRYNRLDTGNDCENDIKTNHGQHRLSWREESVAMTLGAELRRAYVKDLVVLANGTLVSANADGRVQLWTHGALEHEEVHLGGEGDVDSAVALANNHTTFATAGRGCVYLWTIDAEPVMALPGAMPGTTLTSLVSLSSLGKGVTCLEARFHITRHSNANQ